MTVQHNLLAGLNLHKPYHYEQDTDPGAVGAKKWWFQESTGNLYRRNSTNAGWINVLAASATTLPNTTILPSGTTWTQLLAAKDALPDGGFLYLPNETITQTSAWRQWRPITVRGTGPLSCIKANGDLPLFGSFMQFFLGAPGPQGTPALVDGITFADFTVEHTRNSTNRMAAFNIGSGSSNVHLKNILFKNITSDCVIVLGGALSNHVGTHDIFIYGCTGQEWYESFVNIHEGNALNGIKNVYIFDNTATTTASHPQGGVSDPYGVLISLEKGNGLVENVVVSDNVLTANSSNVVNWMGIMMSYESEVTNFRYNKIAIRNNLISGWEMGINLRAFQLGAVTGPSYVTVEHNTLHTLFGTMINVSHSPGKNIDRNRIQYNKLYQRITGQATVTINQGTSGPNSDIADLNEVFPPGTPLP